MSDYENFNPLLAQIPSRSSQPQQRFCHQGYDSLNTEFYLESISFTNSIISEYICVLIFLFYADNIN